MHASGSIPEITRRVAARLARVKGIAAIVLGGSLARGTADEHSDIDLGLYYDARRPFRIAELESAARELDDRHLPGLVTPFGEWGRGVNGGGWLVVGGRHVDLLYRELGAVNRAIAECRAGKPALVYQLGHPIGFHNQIYAGEIDCCRVLWDPRGKLRRLKRKVAPYPDRLRRAIVTKHLFDACFELAIADKPARRGDTTYVSGCLFRAAGFMTLVVYALNRRWLVNEKGAVAASQKLKTRPAKFEAVISAVLARPGAEPTALSRSVGRMRSLASKLLMLAEREEIDARGFGI